MKNSIIIGLILGILAITIMSANQCVEHNRLIDKYCKLTSQLDKDYNSGRVE